MPLLEFQAINHAYFLDDVRVPSVTQILQAGGAMMDFNKVPQAQLLKARDRGTAVHRAAHYWLEGDFDVEDFLANFPDYAGYLRSLMALFASGRLETVACERRVASPRYGYAGTLDWIGLFDGKATLLDWATGAPKDVAKDLQLSAYDVAAHEWALLGEDPVLAEFFTRHSRLQRKAVQLSKDGSLPKLEPYDDPRLFTEFRSVLDALRVIAKRQKDWLAIAA